MHHACATSHKHLACPKNIHSDHQLAGPLFIPVYEHTSNDCFSLCLLLFVPACRKAHKKDQVTEIARKKRRVANKSAARAIVGVSLEVINKRRAEKPEVRQDRTRSRTPARPVYTECARQGLCRHCAFCADCGTSPQRSQPWSHHSWIQTLHAVGTLFASSLGARL